MCASPNAALAISAFALVGLLACHSDPVSTPGNEGTAPAQLGLGGSTVLVVDNDRADCPRADFTSIQAAVTAADPGSTILVCRGVYPEQVTIAKNDLRLRAKGKPGTVVLDGLDLHTMLAGFLLDNAHGNLIEGFLVRRYHEAGIWLRAASSGNTIRKNLTTESSFHDGIQVLDSPENVIEQNMSFANFSPNAVACGINVLGAGSADNIVRHNETFENDFGIQVAGGAANNVIFHNDSHDNRRVGIRNIVSSNGTLIENNRVLDNGGIAELGGIRLSQSTGVTVARNKAFNNVPIDLFWDGLGVNEFENNHCRTSSPPGLCEHTEGASKE
jgi:parallel beta-helix repeat protein